MTAGTKCLKMFAPWKKNYEKPRQRNKKQRHHFANKSPYNQSYGFSNSHVRICDYWKNHSFHYIDLDSKVMYAF